jgi:hypothetical protein
LLNGSLSGTVAITVNISVAEWQPVWDGGHILNISVAEWQPEWDGGHIVNISVAEWQPEWDGDHNCEYFSC